MTKLKAPINNHDHIIGNHHASIVVVQYADLECPYCAAAHPVLKRISQEFSDKLMFVFRHFPLTNVHPLAQLSAETAEFAAKHNVFWEFIDYIFDNQKDLNHDFLFETIEKFDLPHDQYLEALKIGMFKHRIQGDVEGGMQSGVNGIPALFINDKRYTGAIEYDELLEELGLLS